MSLAVPLTILQACLGLLSFIVGIAKLTPSGGPDGPLFEKQGLSHRALKAAGLVNIFCGALILAGFAMPVLTPPAAILNGIYFLWGIYIVTFRKVWVPHETARISIVACLSFLLAYASAR
jgi:uncharacterized membrane protein YphA (DoxX/SURF4 family)